MVMKPKHEENNPRLKASFLEVVDNRLKANDYDELVNQKSFFTSVERGIADAESGQTFTTNELRKSLKARRIGNNPCA